MPKGLRRGTAIKDHASPDLLPARSPATPRRRQRPEGPSARRFSPLTAPQRALVDRFIAEARPWALRQARKSYRHLPTELHEQAFEQAAVELRTGAPDGLDRRALYADLASSLDEALRRIHVGWCLNRSGVFDVEAPAKGPATDTGEQVARFVEDSLGGLERAVLQLEIGAGRDTHSARAALRLGPRQYMRHRELGFGKLRGAIAGSLAGHVCEHHLEDVTFAATGDSAAAMRLKSGPDRCRACAREAAGLQRLLHNRLAFAPWPLAIKPAGFLAAKIGGLGALLGAKGSATGGGLAAGSLTGASGGVKVIAAALATAAVASGGAAIVDQKPASDTGATAASQTAPAPVQNTSAGAPATTATSAPERTVAKAGRQPGPAKRGKKKQTTRRGRRTPERTATTATQPAGPTTSDGTTAATAPLEKTVRDVEDTVRKTVGGVNDTLKKVKSKLPATVGPDGVDLGGTVDSLTDTVDGLLKP